MTTCQSINHQTFHTFCKNPQRNLNGIAIAICFNWSIWCTYIGCSVGPRVLICLTPRCKSKIICIWNVERSEKWRMEWVKSTERETDGETDWARSGWRFPQMCCRLFLQTDRWGWVIHETRSLFSPDSCNGTKQIVFVMHALLPCLSVMKRNSPDVENNPSLTKRDLNQTFTNQNRHIWSGPGETIAKSKDK